MNDIMAFTSICEEDACWVDQYLAEVERLDVRFAIHLDRCSVDTKSRLTTHELCSYYTLQDNSKMEFNEQHKQKIFNLVNGSDANWAMAWDIDETFETDARDKFTELSKSNYDCVSTGALLLWDDFRYFRSDSGLAGGKRERILNVGKGINWVFRDPRVNGPRAMVNGRVIDTTIDRDRHLECLHWGLMTHELRVLHKERWDRIYRRAGGKNPYGFWNHILNPDLPLEVTRHEYLKHMEER